MHAGRERRQRLDRRVGVRGLGVVHELDARGARDGLEPVRQGPRTRAARGRCRPPRRRPPAPRRPPRSRSRGCGRRVGRARSQSISTACARVTVTRSPRPGSSTSRRAGSSPFTTAVSPGRWFSKMRSLQRRYSSKLPCRSRWSGVAFRSTADPAPERVDVLQLKARELAGDPRAGVDSAGQRRQRAADVARDLARHAARPEHRAEQLGGRRLPVRPRDARDRVGEHARGKLDLAPDRRRPRRAPPRPGRSATEPPGSSPPHSVLPPAQRHPRGRVRRRSREASPRRRRGTRRPRRPPPRATRAESPRTPRLHSAPARRPDTAHSCGPNTTVTGTSRRRGSRGRSRSPRRSPP